MGKKGLPEMSVISSWQKSICTESLRLLLELKRTRLVPILRKESRKMYKKI